MIKYGYSKIFIKEKISNTKSKYNFFMIQLMDNENNEFDK